MQWKITSVQIIVIVITRFEAFDRNSDQLYKKCLFIFLVTDSCSHYYCLDQGSDDLFYKVIWNLYQVEDFCTGLPLRTHKKYLVGIYKEI